ncbi:hypothetical protein D9M70_178360 [compost metagenome]
MQRLAQFAPALDNFALLCLAALQRLVELGDLGIQGGQAAAQGFALLAHLVLGGLAVLQALLGGRQVERLVFGDGRVFVGAAQWTGFAGLQGRAIGLQLLDALFLFEELFLVGNLLLELGEATTQAIALFAQGLLLILQGQQLLARPRLPLSQLPALLGKLFQALQLAATFQQLLPLVAQGSIVLTIQQRVEPALGFGLRLLSLRLLSAGVFQCATSQFEASRQFTGLASQARLRSALLGQLRLAPGQDAEFRLPGPQILAQAGPLRLLGQTPLQGFSLVLEAF